MGSKWEQWKQDWSPSLHIALVILVACMLIPRLASASVSNISGNLLVRGCVTGRSNCGASSALLVELTQHFEFFLSPSAKSSLGRTALVAGDFASAGKALGLSTQSDRLPVEVVGRYVQDDLLPSSTLKDSVADECLRQAQMSLSKSDTGKATVLLEAALLLRPGDLYAHYQLLSLRQNEAPLGQHHREALIYFAEDAVRPSGREVVPYADRVVPMLISEAIWTYDQATRVVAFLVWKYSHVDTTETLLRTLCAQYPADVRWRFYLGELYHRRGDWNEAEETYLQVIDLDPDYAQACLRLGMIAERRSSLVASEAQGDCLRQAIDWYEVYHELVPRGLLGLRKLAENHALLESAQSGRLARELTYVNGDEQLAARLLDVSPRAIELGDNLILGGDFETWTNRGRWRYRTWPNMANRPSFERVLFLGGTDDLQAVEGKMSARVDAVRRQAQTGTIEADAGFRHEEISMPVDALWLVAFSYRTMDSRVGGSAVAEAGSRDNGERSVGIWLTTDRWLTGEDSTGFANDMFLPLTEGAWRREAILIHNLTGESVRVRPLLRSSGAQSVWFDDVVVRPVEIDQSVLEHIPARVTTWQ